MRVSAINCYDHVSKTNSQPQPCPAPVPYATKPNFGASLKMLPPLIHNGWKKVLTLVAAFGLAFGVSAKQNSNAEQILPVATNPIELKSTDGPDGFVLAFSVKDSDGTVRLKGLKVADDANYIIDIDGDRYAVYCNDLEGFKVYHGRELVNSIELSPNQYIAIAKVARNADDAHELSPSDIANLPEGAWGSYVVKNIPDVPPGWVQKEITANNGSIINISVHNSPTANPYH